MIEDTLAEETTPEVETPKEESQDAGKMEKRYKDLQSWATKISQEKAELQRQFDEMNGKLALLSQAPAKQSEPEPDFLDDIEAADLIDNPENLKKLIAFIKHSQDEIPKSLIGQITELLDARDKAFEEKLSGFNPENLKKKDFVKQYSDEINELKEDPELKDLDDYALAVMASRLKPKETDVYIPIPTVGGHRVSKTNDGDKKREARIDAWLEENGYNEANGFK